MLSLRWQTFDEKDRIQELYPVVKNEDLVGGIYMPKDGQADPVSVTNLRTRAKQHHTPMNIAMRWTQKAPREHHELFCIIWGSLADPSVKFRCTATHTTCPNTRMRNRWQNVQHLGGGNKPIPNILMNIWSTNRAHEAMIVHLNDIRKTKHP